MSDKTILLVLSSLLLGAAACSGGTDPVRTMGGFGEDPGPGSPNPQPDPSYSSVSKSGLEVLCIKACAHRFATDCMNEPKAAVGACEQECAESGGAAGQCADEIATLYDCQADAKYLCESGTAVTDDCKDALTKVDKCLVPGGFAGCVPVPENDPFCEQNFPGLPNYHLCSQEGPGLCVEVGAGEFCCP